MMNDWWLSCSFLFAALNFACYFLFWYVWVWVRHRAIHLFPLCHIFNLNVGWNKMFKRRVFIYGINGLLFIQTHFVSLIKRSVSAHWQNSNEPAEYAKPRNFWTIIDKVPDFPRGGGGVGDAVCCCNYSFVCIMDWTSFWFALLFKYFHLTLESYLKWIDRIEKRINKWLLRNSMMCWFQRWWWLCEFQHINVTINTWMTNESA